MATSNSAAQGDLIVDDTRAPVLRLRYAATFTEDEFARHIAALNDVIDAVDGSFAIVADIDDAPPPSSPIRAQCVDFWRRNKVRFKADLKSLTYVTHKRAMKGVVIAFNWFAPLPTSFHFERDVDTAVAKAEDRLRTSRPVD